MSALDCLLFHGWKSQKYDFTPAWSFVGSEFAISVENTWNFSVSSYSSYCSSEKFHSKVGTMNADYNFAWGHFLRVIMSRLFLLNDRLFKSWTFFKALLMMANYWVTWNMSTHRQMCLLRQHPLRYQKHYKVLVVAKTEAKCLAAVAEVSRKHIKSWCLVEEFGKCEF